MANEEHLAILKKGVDAWNVWRAQHPDVRVDLRGADLYREILSGANFANGYLDGADLSGAILDGADLSGADLREANLNGGDLRSANLQGANFRDANVSCVYLSYANLWGANLSGANVRGTDLVWANLSGADLGGTDFSKATFDRTVLADVDLGTAKGLETVRHGGPSTIGVDTIYRSQGRIPKVFLRGAGLPDTFIEYIHSLVYSGIEFYSCFISYSGKDQEFADRLYADLQNKGVRWWFAPRDIQGGRKIHEQLDEAIRSHDKLLLVLSEHSMNSDWVGTEIANAREREAREGKQMLFPIAIVPFEMVRSWKLFDAERGKDSAREIREFFIPDFSNWKDHDSFQNGFDRLPKDLKSPDAGAKSAATAMD